MVTLSAWARSAQFLYFLETIKQEARVLPLYEERIHKFKYTRGYSLNNNEMLKCRWTQFSTARKPKIPFKFPSVNDMHFYKNTVMHAPEESVNQRENHRFHLRSGPGIDRFGQLPIPNEMQFRKSAYHENRHKNINKHGIDKTEVKKSRS
ncbi:hypothetical protein PYW07_013300 [Mythimna separata]|uniref:Uncharacterized protein n=1 Tax=Mythimna separata TaxID=271217 RepID=A0AAD8DKB3_MYTSE|nr:hypothetical protein PYW07_013300 [Mythimna separata]